MSEHRLSKEEFKNEMKQKRLALFKKANEQLDIVTSDSSSLLKYLKLQALIGYNATNTLLVMSENPDATYIKDYARWKEFGAFPKKDEKGIPILEPSKEYTRKDGTKGINYNIKHVFDVSQTNYKGELPSTPIKESLIKAITYKTDIDIEYLDNTSHLNKSIYLDKTANKMYIQKGLSSDDMIRGLLREFVLVENGINQATLTSRFEISCVLFMLYCKYGIEPITANFALECLDYFKNKDDKEKKMIFKNIKFIFDNITKRINYGLYAESYYQEMERDAR